MFAPPLAYYQYSSLVNAVACGAISLVVFWKQPKFSAARLFSLLTLLISLWSWFYFLWLLVADDPQRAEFLVRTCMLFVMFMPSVFLQFSTSLTGRLKPWWIHALNYLLSGFLTLTVYTPLFSPGVGPHLVFLFRPLPGKTFFVHLVQMFSCVSYGLWLIATTARKSEGQFRLQLWWTFWAHFIGWISGFSNYFLWSRWPVPPLLNPFVPLYVLGTAYAIVKHQLMDIKVVLKKSLVYSGLVACITGMYLVMVMVMERWFQGFMGYRSIVATVVVAFVIALCFNPLRDWIQTFVDRALFKATAPELAAQREQLLTELRKSDQMKAVATLAAGLAHEIKNPLSAIKTFTDYLPERYQEPGFLKTFHRIVGQEVEKIHATVQNLLAFAKPQAMKRERLALAPLVQDMVTLLAGDCLKRQVQVEEAVPAKLYVLGDRTQLKQVLLNLCLNSLDAMEGAGGRLRIAATQQDAQVVLTIQDTGPGIPPEALAKVFDPFFTTKATGTGLGLSVVQGIVQEHGGQISLASQLGHGTTVTVRWPVADEKTEIATSGLR